VGEFTLAQTGLPPGRTQQNVEVHTR
jgi:hypothetical protein